VRQLFIFALLLATQPVFSQEPVRWRDRFETPGRRVIAWADKAPQKIIFTTNQSGVYQLYFYDLDKKTLLQLTQGFVDRDYGALSPDGKEALYFKKENNKQVGQIYRIALAKEVSEKKLLSDFPDKSIGAICWGKSGKAIYFTGSQSPGFGIYRYQLKDKAPAEIFKSTMAITAMLPSWDEKYVAYSLGTDVYVLDLHSGKVMPVLSGGSCVAWAKEGDLSRLLVTGASGGFARPAIFSAKRAKIEWLDFNLQGDIAAQDWLPGGKEVLLRQLDQAQTYLWRYDLGAKAITLVLSPNGYVARALPRERDLLWLDFESSEHPRDFFSWDPKDSGFQSILPDSLDAQSPSLAPTGYIAKSVKFPSWDRTKIQGWLIKPKEENSKARRSAVIFLRGDPLTYSGNQWDPELLAYVDHGYTVLSLNYRGSGSFGKKFTDQIIGNPGKNELEDINAARNYLIAEAGVAQDRVIVAGNFYGGYLTLFSLTHYPHLWAAACAMEGIADWRLLYRDALDSTKNFTRNLFGGTPEEKADLYFERSPVAQIEQIQTPVLIIQNTQNARVPKRQMDDFVDNLKVLKKRYRYATFSADTVVPGTRDRIKFTEELLWFLYGLGLGPAPYGP